MKYRILGLFLIVSMVVFSGCSKINKNIISGVEKIVIATEKITPHTIELIEERIIKLQREIDNAATEEDKSFWAAELKKEISYLTANKKLPEALRELLKTLRDQ